MARPTKKYSPERRAELKEAYLAMLKESCGVMQPACEAVHVDRSQIYRWRKADKAFDKACKEVEDVAIDFVENKLFQNIDRGDTKAIIFFLKTKGRSRGYDLMPDIEIGKVEGVKVTKPTIIFGDSEEEANE